MYNRADNTRRTLDALMANTLAPHTDVYVFSDGGRDDASWRQVNEVRAVLHEVQEEVARTHSLKSMTIVERPVNFYLERNIIEGIGQVFERHDTIIVLEDDIVTAPHFLEFMNDAFSLYDEDKRVMHVSGFTRIEAPSDSPKGGENRSRGNSFFSLFSRSLVTRHSPSMERPFGPSASFNDEVADSSFVIRHSPSMERPFGPSASFYFSPFMAGWGWGTWRDRWQHHFRHFATRAEAIDGLSSAMLTDIEYGGVFPCLKDLDRKPIPWDICWTIAIRRTGGLCLYPCRTLVKNIGLDGGTHYSSLPRWVAPLIQYYEYDRIPYDGRITLTRQKPETNARIEAAMKTALTDWGIRYTWLGKVVRRIYKGIKN